MARGARLASHNRPSSCLMEDLQFSEAGPGLEGHRGPAPTTLGGRTLAGEPPDGWGSRGFGHPVGCERAACRMTVRGRGCSCGARRPGGAAASPTVGPGRFDGPSPHNPRWLPRARMVSFVGIVWHRAPARSARAFRVVRGPPVLSGVLTVGSARLGPALSSWPRTFGRRLRQRGPEHGRMAVPNTRAAPGRTRRNPRWRNAINASRPGPHVHRAPGDHPVRGTPARAARRPHDGPAARPGAGPKVSKARPTEHSTRRPGQPMECPFRPEPRQPRPEQLGSDRG